MGHAGHAGPDEEAPREFVIRRLEEAGATLLAMRLHSVGPQGVRSNWPEVMQDWWINYGARPEPARPAIPGARDISAMDEALGWITRIPLDRYVLRRIVGARALVSPATQKHVFTWRRLGKVIGAHHQSVQLWHAQGIGLIVKSLIPQNIPIHSIQNMPSIPP